MSHNSVILIRHAESEHHTRKLSGGWTDTPITELGHRQANLVAARLKAELGSAPVRLIASDLIRARETAEHIAGALGVEVRAEPRLREFNNGAAAGLSVEEVERRWPRAASPMGLDERPWPGCETWREFYARAGHFFDSLSMDGPTPILVTHGGTVYALVAHWLGLAPEQMKAVNFSAHVTSVTVLRDWNGLRDVERLNDVSHLIGTDGYVALGDGPAR